jgi:anti-sigma28 factor (negative regulator of flagellin synthesis)
MDIRKLNTDGFIDRKKIDRFTRTDAATPASSSAQDAESSQGSDSVDITGLSAGEVTFARQAYKNLNQQSLEKVKLIRQQILSGQYDIQGALDKATRRIVSDVKSLDVVELSGLEAPAKNTPLVKLTEEALDTISRKVLRDISNL